MIVQVDKPKACMLISCHFWINAESDVRDEQNFGVELYVNFVSPLPAPALVQQEHSNAQRKYEIGLKYLFQKR